jgi:hypothetical protein
MALVFNPSEAYHRAKLRAAVEERQPITKLFGISQLAIAGMKYKSYGFVLLMSLGDRKVTVGLYGYVYVVNP